MKKKSVAKIIGHFFYLALNYFVGTDFGKKKTEEKVENINQFCEISRNPF